MSNIAPKSEPYKPETTRIESELEQARTRQQLMQQLEQVNNDKPTTAAIDAQIPAIANLSKAFGLNPTTVKTHFLVVFASFFELLGVVLFLFNHYASAISNQRSSKPIQT
jgi:hypothetical protein